VSSNDRSDELLELLGQERVREILAATSRNPKSAKELSEECDVAPSTIYRRVERLQAQRLLDAEQRIDPDGHHYEVYAASLQRVTVELTEDGIELDVDRGEDPADRFTRLYEGFK